MPFQNTGTLLENLTLVAATRLLLSTTEGLLDVASAFSMPPLTVWRRAERYADASPLFTIQQLDAVARAAPDASPHTYRALLHQCLTYDRLRGPNGALLVGLLAAQHGRPLRAWVEDTEAASAHYGPTQSHLEALGTYVSTIGQPTDGSPFRALVATDTPYPDCLRELRTQLSTWMRERPAAARLGYLDPNVYAPHATSGPRTSSASHRRWLQALRKGDPDWAVSVHFSSNRDVRSHLKHLTHLHDDARQAGYTVSRTYRHQAHTTTVSVYNSYADKALRYANALDETVQADWTQWEMLLDATTETAPPTKPLRTYTSRDVEQCGAA